MDYGPVLVHLLELHQLEFLVVLLCCLSSRKDRAPRATPASLTAAPPHAALLGDGKPKYSMARMEVQEVFEFEELNRFLRVVLFFEKCFECRNVEYDSICKENNAVHEPMCILLSCLLTSMFLVLFRNWNETFEQKQYLVWVPNTNKKKKRRRKSTSDALNRYGSPYASRRRADVGHHIKV